MISFSLALRLSFYGVALSGFAALGVAGALGPLPAVVVGLCLLMSFPERRSFRFSGTIWNVLAVALLFLCAVRYAAGTDPLHIGGDLLVFGQCHRLESQKTNRDWWFVVVVAFGQILLATILTVDPLFFPVFLLWLVTLTWALLLLRLKIGVDATRGGEDSSSVEDPYALLRPLLGWRSALGVGATTFLTLLATLSFFFILPRFEASLMRGGSGSEIHVAGFSPEVHLGEVGRIQSRRNPVLRMRMTDREGKPYTEGPQYLYGLALDRFDGRSWSLSSLDRIPLSPTGPGWPAPDVLLPDTDVVADLTMEPSDSEVLFFPGVPLGIYGEFTSLEAASTEGYHPPRNSSRRRYVVHSDLDRSAPETLRQPGGPIPEDIARSYLQLPSSLSARVRALAEKLAQEAVLPYDRALRVEQFLARGDFRYSMDNAPGRADPLDDFLFETREGHCEYFASAMVVLLRAQGIPSRIVNGFLAQDYLPAGGYFLVRQNDAHSWVEVWIAGGGWQRFDPTPGRAGEGVVRLTALGRLQQYMDVFQDQWNRVILDYNLSTQFAAWNRLAEAMAGLGGGGGSLPGFGDAFTTLSRGKGGPGAGGSALGALFLGIAIAGALILRNRLFHREARGAEALPPGVPRRFGALVLKLAEGASSLPGHPCPSGTLAERLSGAEALFPQTLSGLSTLAGKYYAARWDGFLPGASDLKQAAVLASALGTVRRGVRRKKMDGNG